MTGRGIPHISEGNFIEFSIHPLQYSPSIRPVPSALPPTTTAYDTAATANFKKHIQSCKLHEEDRSQICAGFMRRGKAQCTKPANSHIPGSMPTCKLHRDQNIPSYRCKVPLSCGEECGKICQWIPHAFQRCSAHRDFEAPCYFLELMPIELRIRIYGYLLPGKEVPANAEEEYQAAARDSTLGSGAFGFKHRAQMAICRVNRQIHDEAAGLLYGSSAFTISLDEKGLRMCNSTPTTLSVTLPGVRANHALQDYQMQLMLLEQQNKKRLMMARQAPINANHSSTFVAGPSSSQRSRMNNAAAVAKPHVPDQFHPQNHFHSSGKNPILYAPIPLGATWEAPLSAHYFNLIHSFRINISFVSARQNSSVRPMYLPPADVEEAAKKEQIYEFVDQIHRVVSRLQCMHHRIHRLEVSIFFDRTLTRAEDSATAQLLLRPFERLCYIQDAVFRCLDANRISMLRDEHNSSFLPHIEGLGAWSNALAAPTPALVPGAEFEAYWRLVSLLIKISQHCHGPASRLDSSLRDAFGQFSDMRHKARIAREEGDLESLRVSFAMVMDVWHRYVDLERAFQDEMGVEIEGMWGVVGL